MHPEFEEADFATWSSQNLQEAAAFPLRQVKTLTCLRQTARALAGWWLSNYDEPMIFCIFVIFLRFLEQKYFQYCKFVKNCSN